MFRICCIQSWWEVLRLERFSEIRWIELIQKQVIITFKYITDILYLFVLLFKHERFLVIL